jgi:predicted transcriptional regulator
MQLFDWIKAQNVSISQFSRNIGVERVMVYRYFAGSVPRFEIIRRIEKITRGKVTAQDFYVNALARARQAEDEAAAGETAKTLPATRLQIRPSARKAAKAPGSVSRRRTEPS